MKRVLIVVAIVTVLALGATSVFLGVAGISASLPDVGSLERHTPDQTSLMRRRVAEARAKGHDLRISQRWVPYGRISPLLRRAVLIAEDDAFFSHDGLDWDEIRASMRRNVEARRIVRGGSTITQQLAKNLYLSNDRTLSRKLREILLAGRLERALTKRRIFELYLNLIEWGDGVFGIEAAARRHFGVSAATLDARQSALLAAVIINPRRFDPARPNRRIERRARMILGRMWRSGVIIEAEYLVATGRAAPAPAETSFATPRDSAALPAAAQADTLPATADSLPR